MGINVGHCVHRTSFSLMVQWCLFNIKGLIYSHSDVTLAINTEHYTHTKSKANKNKTQNMHVCQPPSLKPEITFVSTLSSHLNITIW